MRLEELLESFKNENFHYSVAVFWGEGTGCDDSGASPKDRMVRIFMNPAGYLGEMRRAIITTADRVDRIDPTNVPKVVSNPPPEDIMHEPGDYVWGTDHAVQSYIRKLGELSLKEQKSRRNPAARKPKEGK